MRPDPSRGGDGLVLRTREVVKDFVGLRAVDGVSLTLNQGEILGLIGPNGSGKTTLINVITGLLPINSGEVWVGGTNITGWPPHRIAPIGVARSFQVVRPFRELTVLENLEVAAVGARNLTRREARRRSQATLEMLGLAESADLPAGTLPYGHERRVEIARGLATEPSFLLLDEPGGGLNDAEVDDLLQRLTAIRREMGCGILVVDHDMRLILRLCDRLHVLNYGRTIAEGSREQVRGDPAVIEAYLGSEGGQR